MYVNRMVAGWNWELRILKAFQRRFSGQLGVRLEEFVGGSRRSMDIVLNRGVRGVRRAFIEAKGWNFDTIVRWKQRADGMLEQLESQAQFYSEANMKVIYVFKQTAQTEAGKKFMREIIGAVTSHGHKATVGTQQAVEQVEKILF